MFILWTGSIYFGVRDRGSARGLKASSDSQDQRGSRAKDLDRLTEASTSAGGAGRGDGRLGTRASVGATGAVAGTRASRASDDGAVAGDDGSGDDTRGTDDGWDSGGVAGSTDGGLASRAVGHCVEARNDVPASVGRDAYRIRCKGRGR